MRNRVKMLTSFILTMFFMLNILSVPAYAAPEKNEKSEDIFLIEPTPRVMYIRPVPLGAAKESGVEIIISDEEIPLASPEDVPGIVIEDEKVPLADVPQTGGTGIAVLFVLSVASIGGAVTLSDGKKEPAE